MDVTASAAWPSFSVATTRPWIFSVDTLVTGSPQFVGEHRIAAREHASRVDG